MSLALNELYKSFGGNQVISGVTLEVEDRKVTSLVGPNGAGKTTLFNIITGFIPADSGTIRFADRSLDGLAPQAVKQHGLVRTFQNLRLFLNMTVHENVLVALESDLAVNFWSKATLPPVEKVLRRVGLWEQRKKMAGELSYAEKKFLSLARVLVTGAPCLLLDEPASGLDGPSLVLFHELIREFKNGGGTVLLIEHNLDIVRGVSDHIVFLDKGQIAASGTPDEIFSNPVLGELYFGIRVGGAQGAATDHAAR
jgi:branched-chain amino acid transport system ATP-binding protein